MDQRQRIILQIVFLTMKSVMAGLQHSLPHTFWLFTKGNRCVKGEGRTDADALNIVRNKLGIPKPQ